MLWIYPKCFVGDLSMLSLIIFRVSGARRQSLHEFNEQERSRASEGNGRKREGPEGWKRVWETPGAGTQKRRCAAHLLLRLLPLVLLFFPQDSAPTELSTHGLLQVHQLLQSHVPSQGQQVHQQEGGEHGGLLCRTGAGKQGEKGHQVSQAPVLFSLMDPWLMCSTPREGARGLPWWRTVNNPPANAADTGFHPWSRKIPHALEPLGPGTTAAEPVRQSLPAIATTALVP